MANIPAFDSSDHSFEVLQTFTPNFYEYLRNEPNSLQTLMLLYKNGNEKAGEIITYLMGTPSHLESVHKLENQKTLQEKFENRGGTTYNIAWTEPEIKKESDKKFVIFEVEAFFRDEMREFQISYYYLSHKHRLVFRKEFIEKEISEWLKEKGYRLRKSHPKDINKGALYGSTILEFFGSKVDPEHDHLRVCRHAKANCKFEIVPINN